MRKDAREIVYKLIFEYSFSRVINEKTLDAFLKTATLTESDVSYVQSTFQGVVDRYEELTDCIMRHCVGYSSPDRLNRADLAALLLGAYEIKYASSLDVPVAVAINEAVSLSKQFGGEKSSGFVNGVLSSVNKENG